MYQDNMLEMLSQIEKEDQERRVKHALHRAPQENAKYGSRFLAFVSGLTNRLRLPDESVTIQKRATSEVPGV